MEIEPGVVVAERYRLVKPIGRGAQAHVWVAEHLALSTNVAVKLIERELAKQEDARERFRREATAAARLRSANVVQILDHGIDGDQPYIVMELLEGEDLFQRIDRKGRLSLKETSKIITQVARALSRAHTAGVIHRDLKPENVFLVPNEDEEIAKVLDFGVAKIKDPSRVTMQRTGVGTLIGTPHYMSPEQVKGTGEIDYRADLWGLGVITFQCVTGDLPIDSEGVGDLLIKITLGQIPVPSDVIKTLPQSFDAWFKKACAKDADDRFQTAREMADALAKVVEDEGKAPPRPGKTVPPSASVPPPPDPAVAKRAQQPTLPGDDDADELDGGWDDDSDESKPAAKASAENKHAADHKSLPPIDVELSDFSSRPPPPKPPAKPSASSAKPEAKADEVEEVEADPSEPPPEAKPSAAPADKPAKPPKPPKKKAAAKPEAQRPPEPALSKAVAATSNRAAPKSTRGPQLHNTVTGLGSTMPPPPELDPSRKRKVLRYVIAAFVLLCGGIVWLVVSSQLRGTNTPRPAVSTPRPKDPTPIATTTPTTDSAVDTAPSADASASASAVDPGEQNKATVTPPPPPAVPYKPPPKDDEDDLVIEIPLPDKPVPQ